MRRIVLIASLAGAMAVPAAGAVTAPSLRVVTRSPLVVTGSHFRSRESVTVSSGTTKVVVRTGPTGTFRVELGSPATDRCSFSVVALGARGDRATIAWRTMCAPASTS